MENYKKTRTIDQPCPCPFPDLPGDTPEVKVKDGSKIRNLMRFALSRMEEKPTDEGSEMSVGMEPSLCRQILFTGVGQSVSKAITCVEITKRRIHGLHQLTKLAYHTVQDIWDPLEPTAGLDSITVSRNVPSIWVLLSRDPLDRSQSGYQAPGSFDAFWVHSVLGDEGPHRVGPRRKRGGLCSGRGDGGSRGKDARKHLGRRGDAQKAQGRVRGGFQD